MNKNDTKLKVDALEWRVELPVASKAALRVRFSSFFSLSLSCVSSRSFFSVLSHCFQESISPNCDSSLKQMKESKGDAMSATSAADARASAVLTLRGSRASDLNATANATTTNVRLSEEDCVKLRDSMDEAAKRVKEVMEKYGGEEGEK